MKCMTNEVVHEASITVVPADKIITDPVILTDIDINTCDINAVNFSSNFDLIIQQDGQLTSLVGYFDTFFELTNLVSFSTGPYFTPTHWKQTVFYLREPISVTKGKIFVVFSVPTLNLRNILPRMLRRKYCEQITFFFCYQVRF